MTLTKTQLHAMRYLEACSVEGAILPIYGVLEATLQALSRKGLAVVEQPTADSPRIACLTDAGREWLKAHPVKPPPGPRRPMPRDEEIFAACLRKRFARRR